MRTCALSLMISVFFLLALHAPAQENPCKPTDIVIVDRSLFSPTIQNALSALEKANLAGTAQPYGEGSDIKKFAQRIAGFRPKLVVAHYSMFAPGRSDRGQVLNFFVTELEASKNPPLGYAIYSSSFHDARLHPEGLTLAMLKKKGYFQGIDDDRIALIFVPNGARFQRGNGDEQLRAAARRILGPRDCR